MRKCINPAPHLYCWVMAQPLHRVADSRMPPSNRWLGAWASEATIQSPNGSSSEARRPGPHTRPMMSRVVCAGRGYCRVPEGCYALQVPDVHEERHCSYDYPSYQPGCHKRDHVDSFFEVRPFRTSSHHEYLTRGTKCVDRLRSVKG